MEQRRWSSRIRAAFLRMSSRKAQSSPYCLQEALTCMPRRTTAKPLHWAMRSPTRGEIAALLLTDGADLYARSSNGETPLHIAARHGATLAAELLMLRGANVKAVCANGMTPLHVTGIHLHKDIMQLLLDAGAEVNRIATDGWMNGLTPLHLAARASQSRKRHRGTSHKPRRTDLHTSSTA